jgi:hypothetical protein
MAKFNIARDGAPKRLTDPAVHPGMYHVTENPDGSKSFNAGISRTQAAHPLDDTPNVIQPNERFEKRQTPVSPAFGMRPGDHNPSVLEHRAAHVEGQGQSILDSIASDGYAGHIDHVKSKIGKL